MFPFCHLFLPLTFFVYIAFHISSWFYLFSHPWNSLPGQSFILCPSFPRRSNTEMLSFACLFTGPGAWMWRSNRPGMVSPHLSSSALHTGTGFLSCPGFSLENSWTRCGAGIVCPGAIRKWQPTPVFLLGKSHGQRSLAGYSLWGYKSWTWLKWLNNSNNKCWGTQGKQGPDSHSFLPIPSSLSVQVTFPWQSQPPT